MDTLADTTSGHVVDMTETCRQHVADTTQNVADTTQNVAVWAKKRHADIRHMELSTILQLPQLQATSLTGPTTTIT